MTDRSHTPHRGRTHALRFIILGAIFAVICLVYAARLIKLQLEDTQTYFEYLDGDLASYTVTVKASRGALCDRNGTVLVSDRDSYDLRINYDTMASDNEGINDMILHALLALQRSGNDGKLCADSTSVGGLFFCAPK